MSLTATDFAFDKPARRRGGGAGPVIDEMPWGYSIHDRTRHPGLQRKLSSVSRFLGTFSMFALATVLVTPDYGANNIAFSVKVTLLFALGLGAALFAKAGQGVDHPEFHIDTRTNEIRVGRHDVKGQFTLTARLGFEDVRSVYLLRSKERGRPALLFLRLDDAGNALEVTSGPERMLERLRERLRQDLARKPLRARPARPLPTLGARKVVPRRVTV